MTRLTTAEAAKRMGKSEETIRRWIRAGLVQQRYGTVDEEELLDAGQEMWRNRRNYKARPPKLGVSRET